MYYIISNNRILFRSTDKDKLYAKFEFMLAHAIHANTLVFTDTKPVQPKQYLNVSVLSY